MLRSRVGTGNPLFDISGNIQKSETIIETGFAHLEVATHRTYVYTLPQSTTFE